MSTSSEHDVKSINNIESIETSHDAIEREFNKYNFPKSLIESIWNSLDSNATKINIKLELINEIGNISRIIISDNGDGIVYKDIPLTFKKYKESQKHNNKSPMTKGEKGLGRFAFHKFAHGAKWISKSNSGFCEIQMNSDDLSEFKREQLLTSTEIETPTGTKVIYDQINKEINKNIFDTDVIPYLISELSCHILVSDAIEIKADGYVLQPILHDKIEDTHKIGNFNFAAKYIEWNKSPKNKSFIYFVSKKTKRVVHKEPTKTNNKSGFYSSAYIESDFFDDFEVSRGTLELSDRFNLDSKEFKGILNKSRDIISDMYLAFRRREAERLIEEYDQNGIFPDYEKNGDVPIIAEYKKDALKETIKVLYQAEPSLFKQINGNKKHTQIFISLLDRITFSPSDDLFSILDGVINLSKQEESDLADILKENKLSSITRAISAITKRQEVINILKNLIDNHTNNSKEKHIQKIIENNLWIFGEQYHLLTAEEPDFEDALRELLKINDNEDYYQKGTVLHDSKNREMDIFCARRYKEVDIHGKEYYRCLVIELKRAKENIKDKHYMQLADYYSVIETHKDFSDGNHVWDFLLIGKDMGERRSTPVIRGLLKENKNEPGLLMTSDTDEHRLYCRTWSNLFSSYEIKHKHLLDNLNLQAKNIMQKTPDELSERAAKLGKEI